jgi:signal transduction histidine kinase
VTLRQDAEEASLLVEDDGRGFEAGSPPAEWPASDGIGLLGMQERVESLDGELEVDSRPGEGTRVEARIPARKAYDAN